MTKRIQISNPGSYETHQSSLEAHYIDDFLRSKGYKRADLAGLPPEQAKQLMIEACRYASMKLAEHEARAKFSQEIHYD